MQATQEVVEIENAVVRNASCAAPVARSDDGLSAFLGARPRLFGIAYRMLGSAAAAEDIVQDVWIRWQTTDRRSICNPLAFLVTATTRLAINVRQSARSRRESNLEPLTPEPVDTSVGPELAAERGEGVLAGLRLLLQKLSPTERAAYILREAFDYTYRDIANVLKLEEANARQVMTRARQRVADCRALPAGAIEHRRLFEAFIAAATNGDVATLEGTLRGGSRAVPTRQRVSSRVPERMRSVRTDAVGARPLRWDVRRAMEF